MRTVTLRHFARTRSADGDNLDERRRRWEAYREQQKLRKARQLEERERAAEAEAQLTPSERAAREAEHAQFARYAAWSTGLSAARIRAALTLPCGQCGADRGHFCYGDDGRGTRAFCAARFARAQSAVGAPLFAGDAAHIDQTLTDAARNVAANRRRQRQ